MQFFQNFFRNSWAVPLLLFVGATLLFFFSFENKEKYLTVSFLDVGQGDAIFIEAPTGEQMLVDGGPDRRVLSQLSRTMPWLDRSIDVVVATHPDKDHIGGLTSVLDSYRINHVLTSGSTADTDIFAGLVEKVLLEGSEVVLVRRGASVMLGEIQVEVLFPEQVFDVADRNVNSVVLRVTYKEMDFLLTGDVGKEQERYLVEEFGQKLQSEVLKLSHHGSDSSSDLLFLETVRPELAIVSAARNSQYGHPDADVVSRVQALGIPILSTQYEGTIVLRSDGNSIWQE